jgi:hypothetical protein
MLFLPVADRKVISRIRNFPATIHDTDRLGLAGEAVKG